MFAKKTPQSEIRIARQVTEILGVENPTRQQATAMQINLLEVCHVCL